MYRSMAAVLSSFILATPFFASAHTDEYLDSINAPNGGQMRMAGPYHLELVTKNNEILVYVMDQADNKLSVSGGSGKATIQTGNTRTRTSAKLEQAGENILKGSGDFSITPETVITVFVELLKQEAYAASFTPLKPKAKLSGKTRAKFQADSSEGHSHHHMHH
jgi:hypothetical protein